MTIANQSDESLLAEASNMVAGGSGAGLVHPGVVEPGWWSTANAMTMSSIVLLFGLVVLGLAAWLIRSGHAATAVLRVFGTVLVIVMVTFLVVAGYDDKQIAAPLGLLGTIVGYLLGRDAGKPPEAKP